MANKYYSDVTLTKMTRTLPSPRPATDPGSVPTMAPDRDRAPGLPGRASQAFKGLSDGLPNVKRVKEHAHDEGLR